MQNLTMGREGTAFMGDGVRLSWPKGGTRQIVPQPRGGLSLRLKQRIAEGSIELTDEASNHAAYQPLGNLITGRSSALKLRERPPLGRTAVPPVEADVPSVVVAEPMAPDATDSTEEASASEEDSDDGGRVQARRGRKAPRRAHRT